MRFNMQEEILVPTPGMTRHDGIVASLWNVNYKTDFGSALCRRHRQHLRTISWAFSTTIVPKLQRCVQLVDRQ